METFVKLKFIRTENKLTQSQVAEALGITRSAYCGYEIGRRKMSTEMLLELAKFYRLPVSAFLQDENDFLSDNDHYGENTMYLSSLSNEEREIIAKFRTLKDTEKSQLVDALESISKGEK